MTQLLISFFGVLIFVWLAGKFDSVMDMIKDYSASQKSWLYKWTLKHPEYTLWATYGGHVPLPYFEKKGYKHTPGNLFLGDAWHQAKHIMMLSFTGAIALVFTLAVVLVFGLNWYWQLIIQVVLWWFFYWLEGESFNKSYQRLK